ncbi:MAG: bifunctional (p)ppGpp synthetase/guanosine-3',5'-bis(diphosphate) 3'-pyrophosphohydrolase, partial [Rhizobiales bacterium]|nr:bifunctional (p)ppGpp synthetase/guanosine-3',5'-bis(diphosphate) 3'-pyrophosphohydrolase [Hyphomicrobiales bacterium]
RLHNMRTLHFMPEDKRARIAEETLEIYAPLAGRMGMHDMREELEGLAFKVVNPEAYRAIGDRLADIRARSLGLIEEIEKDLRDKFEKNGIKAKVYGREKRPYSIFRKMEQKAISFEQLSDIIGFRVIVGSVGDCYAALGMVHTTWPTVPGRFKDYISTPKQNDYRSIHTTVVGPGRQRVELQIRTREMHDVAEYGIAAHALYKDKVGGRISDESRAYTWLRRTVEMLAEGDTPEEFLENTKLELFHDQVFCFTPKGRLIALPRGATPIDFAYAVHTDVGDTCVGCKLNGRMMPLTTALKNGDEVEIITAKGQVPPPAWESIAVTGKARASIRRAARAAIRKQYAGLGRKIVERAFERAGHEFSEEKMKAALHRLAQQNIEDMLASVGRGEIPSANVLKAVYPDHKEERAAVPKGGNGSGEAGWFGLKKGSGMIFRVPSGDAAESHAIPIRGLSGDMPVRFAPEGGAVPGDRIVGILTPGEGITIYPIQSPSLKAFEDEPERWLDVRWDIDAANRERFPAQIDVVAINEPGTLAQIAQVIADNDGNISNLKIVLSAPDFSQLSIDLEVWDLKHLNRLLGDLRERHVVS